MPRRVEDWCPHYVAGGVPAGHVCDAPIVLIGEAPGAHEEAQGKPFVGPSGALLEKWWSGVGLGRKDFYITNVVPIRPPNNDLKRVSDNDLSLYELELHARLRLRTRANLIVPTGNTALAAVTGKHGISKYRGSILDGPYGKTIPTLHPAGVLREPLLSKTCLYDWARIAVEANFPDIDTPERQYIIHPTVQQMQNFFTYTRTGRFRALAIDIENTRSNHDHIICVGYSLDPQLSITVPFNDQTMWFHRAMCGLDIDKVLQNGLYDLYHLVHHGISVRRYRWDVGAMFHALDPNAGPSSTSKDADDPNAVRSRIKPYSLAYMASIFTREPYWKDDSKEDGGEAERWLTTQDRMDTFLRYNGKDCCVTIELWRVLYDKLEQAGKLDFYRLHYSKLVPAIFDAMVAGTKVDVPSMSDTGDVLRERVSGLLRAINIEAGEPLSATKSYKRKPKDWTAEDGPEEGPYVRVIGKTVSSAKLKAFLFDKLKLPKRTRRGKLTSDEATLRGLRITYPDKCGPLLDKILELRRLEKRAQFLNPDKIDDDGRVRCHYKQLIQTGRLSSTSNPYGTGMNLQNQDRENRHIFKPNDGCMFLEADYSQAEDRVVKFLTGDPVAMEQARRRPDEYDVHTVKAIEIFSRVFGRSLTAADITYELRYLGKRGRHAYNYGMVAGKLAEILTKEGFSTSIVECERILSAIEQADPAIAVWQKRTRLTVIRHKRLVNSWGRELSFDGERIDDDVFRRAYAFTPQSEVADLLNQWGWIPLRRFIRKAGLRSQINMQNHDALLASVPPDELFDVMSFLRTTLERPRFYAVRAAATEPLLHGPLVIPVEFTIGPHWKCQCPDCKATHDMIEYKRMPDYGQLEADIKAKYGININP